jgi:cytochrome c-type biogenesis protein CcmE
MMTQLLLFNVTNGLIIGAFYVLMALGLSLILNLSNVINFAHGGFLVIGGYIAYTITPYIGFWGALNAMRDSIVFFSTPAAVAEKHIPAGKRFRLGGLVQPGSLVRGDNLAVGFLVADDSATLAVSYKGILPDLFREGQGVVAEGALDSSGVFRADTVLAKHDETYMPKDVADALKKQGHWKDDYGAKPDQQAGAAATSRAAQSAPRADRGAVQ